MSKKRHWAVAALAVLGLLIAAMPQARADVVLTDLNSTVVIDPDSDWGIYDWYVNGVDHLYQQWFWLRLDGDSREHPLNTLGSPGVVIAQPNIAVITYSGRGLTVSLTLTLLGGSPGTMRADLAESISIRSTDYRGSVSFFQYADFDLNGQIGGQTVQIVGGDEAHQKGGGAAMTETIVGPQPSRYEAGLFPSTLLKLTDNDIDNLNNLAGPVTGDATWAFQWDFFLGPGGSYLISKDKMILPVPEPAAILLVGSVLLLVGRRLRARA